MYSKNFIEMIKTMKKILFTLALLLAIGQGAWAQTSYDYIERAWDSDNKVVTETIKTLNVGDYTAINGSDTSDEGWVGLYNGWYVVTGNSEYKALNVQGNDVHLVLPDGVTLTVTHVKLEEGGPKLTIHGQSGDTGKLVVDNNYNSLHGGFQGAAGIGGGSEASAGMFVVQGGTVTVKGGFYAAGIGGGKGKGFGVNGGFDMYGGNVTAVGGIESGAGIGSGKDNSNMAGFINIYGGMVEAKGNDNSGGYYGAGIGGGYGSNGAVLHVYGGTVNAYGPKSAAAIGGGNSGNGVETYIHGGTVTTDGTIGGGDGYLTSGKGNGGYIEISGGTVVANARSGHAAIGCGEDGESATIKITGGTVEAATVTGAAIGGGYGYDAELDITITGGTITAKGYVGIGAGRHSKLKGSINISGGTIYAEGAFSALGSGENTAEAADMITLAPSMMVNAGTSASTLEGTFPADQRLPACIYRNYAKIEPCTHSGATYTVSGTTVSDTHLKHCAYCTTTFTADTHTFVDGICSVCNVEQQTYTATVYVPATAGGGLSGYESVQLKMVPGSVFNLPGSGVTLSGREFAGWLVGYPTEENDFVATSTETLLPQGTEYTINADVTFTARYSYLDISLSDNADNGEMLYKYNGMTAHSVTLSGRTLYKDGYWNTLCLPFGIDDFDGTIFEDATVKTLGNSQACNTGLDESTGTLSLEFVEAAEIEPGVAYIVKWTKPDGYDANPSDYDISNPTFNGVTISEEDPEDHAVISEDGKVKFVGKYSPFDITDDNINAILYVASGNKIGYAANTRTLRSFRTHFWVQPNGTSAGARTIVIDWGDGEMTSINSIIPNLSPNGEGSIYTLDGRKLLDVPTQKGVYIVNGRKIVVK